MELFLIVRFFEYMFMGGHVMTDFAMYWYKRGRSFPTVPLSQKMNYQVTWLRVKYIMINTISSAY